MVSEANSKDNSRRGVLFLLGVIPRDPKVRRFSLVLGDLGVPLRTGSVRHAFGVGGILFGVVIFGARILLSFLAIVLV